MPQIPLWFDLTLVLSALLLTTAGAFRWADAAHASERDRGCDPPARRWVPLRMSNCLIILSAIYCVIACIEHPPFGAWYELVLCTWVIVVGSILSAKGY